MAGVVGVIWGNREANYFRDEDWTKRCVICPASNAIGSSVLAKEAYARREGLRLLAMASLGAMRLAADAWIEQDGKRPLAKYIQDAFKNLKAEI
jgi:hypothetical protein